MPDWPHAPTHRLDTAGAYMVTGASYRKQPFFMSAKRLTLLCEHLLDLSSQHGWKLEAWAVFPNHYHFVATSEKTAGTLPRLIDAAILFLRLATRHSISFLNDRNACVNGNFVENSVAADDGRAVDSILTRL